MSLWARLLAFVLATVMVLTPSSALADECTGLQLTPRKVVLGEVEGVWLPKDQAACLAKRAEQLRRAQELVTAHERLVARQERGIELATKTASTAKQLASEQQKRGDDFKALAEQKQRELDEANAWYHSDLFWTGIGATAVTVLVIIFGGVASSTPTINVQR